MRWPQLSTDQRTARLFAESGCKNTDSPHVFAALGSARQVTALARGWRGQIAVAVAVADDKVYLVSVGQLYSSTVIRVDVPAWAVTFTTRQLSPDRHTHTTLVLHALGKQHDIDNVPQAALTRLLQALPAAGATTTPQPAAASWPGPSHPSSTPAARPRTTPTGAPHARGWNRADADWRQAEQMAVRHLRQLGYNDARATPAGADAGADVLATGAVAQVKHWAKPVGQPPLRDMYGVAQARGAKPVFYSRAGYTARALEWANETGLVLFTYTADGQVLAQNSAAHALLASKAGTGGRRLGFFEQRRADGYQREQTKLRRQIDDLTLQMHKRTQSRRATTRQKAGIAARLLTHASRTLDAADVLAPGDRQREDFYKAVRHTLVQARSQL